MKTVQNFIRSFLGAIFSFIGTVVILFLICYGAYWLLGDQNIQINYNNPPALTGTQWAFMLVGYGVTCIGIFLGLYYAWKSWKDK